MSITINNGGLPEAPPSKFVKDDTMFDAETDEGALSALADAQDGGAGNGRGCADIFNKKMLGQIVVVGTGFLADAYDLFVINNVLNIMKTLYPQTSADKSAVASTALWGAVCGQIIFGGFADYIGRKVIFVATLILIAVGGIGSACVFDNETFGIYQQLAFWRFILGLGVGGEYPLAATIAAEASGPMIRGKVMAAVFAMQGFGQLLATGLVTILLFAGCSYEFTWRFCLAFGAVPPLAIFWFRAKMHETEDFKEAKKERVSHWANVKAAVKVWWRPMVGTAAAWFLLDVAFYGNGLFSTYITAAMGLGSSVEDQALNSLYVVLMAIPGYWVSVALLDMIGRWNIQLMGFTILTVLYVILASAFAQLQEIPALFIILYGLTYFFSNFGPNTTTYVIPGEYFPTQVKSTCHGFAAASGKIGAGIAGYAFPPLMAATSVRTVLFVCAGVMAVGALTSVWVPKYSADDLETIKAEQLAVFERLTHEEQQEQRSNQ
eukprot:comp18546_c0_seq1/m.19994 comp18546_c0_seq1/g.19994  ORF comp18546_c0_seq1/g.19994 comp18546_c0_seq1/m.19994 type:complete len:492 (-) comp18546_c0_seq1:719-2194(-)